MLRRCYDPKYHKNSPSYSECTVCEEWKDFQNFAEWYYNNIYNIQGEKICLDKDLLVKGNKVYSPDTCLLVPETLNKLVINTANDNGKYPVGVNYHKHSKKYTSFLSTPNGRKCLGYFNTIEDAFITYKKAKEELILELAENYKSLIPSIVYQALLSYEI